MTSFEVPGAAPMQTVALGIDSENFISGFFVDPAGNQHSFVRSLKAEFHTFDFPGADFTEAYKINDLGQVVGTYSTSFPTHAFILSGVTGFTGTPSPSQFFSFDYPDSENTGVQGIGQGINDRGQIAGSFHLFSDPPGQRHGFIATPQE